MKTRHHIVPESKGGSNKRENIILLEEQVHVNFHRVFGNLSPKLQIEKLLRMASTALKHDVVESVREIIDDEEYIYRDGILRPRYLK